MSKVLELETERLILEKAGTQHISEDYVSWMNDAEVNRYLETGGGYSKMDLTAYLGSAEANEELYFWAIKTKQGQKHIGNIKIDPISYKHGYGEYGILMGDRNEWGKGFAIEASKAVINYCFDKLKLRKVTLGVVAENTAAVNLYRKLGFVEEGCYKYHGIYNNQICDSYRMAIFNPTFLASLNE